MPSPAEPERRERQKKRWWGWRSDEVAMSEGDCDSRRVASGGRGFPDEGWSGWGVGGGGGGQGEWARHEGCGVGVVVGEWVRHLVADAAKKKLKVPCVL